MKFAGMSIGAWILLIIIILVLSVIMPIIYIPLGGLGITGL
jgi:hypothetical protein